MISQRKSVLVVSPDPEFTKTICDALPTGGDTNISTEPSTFRAMNGQGKDLAFKNDLVIFYADPDDSEEVSALSELIKTRSNGTAFMALTNSEISIAKAQKLRDVGVDDVLPASISDNELRNAIDVSLKTHSTLPSAVRSHDNGTEGALIAVSQSRGGAGATTVAVNLAYGLLGSSGILKKTARHRVALVDLDLQFGNANVFLDIEDNGGMFKIIEDVADPDATFMQGALANHASGLDVLCAPTTVAPLNSLSPEKVSAMLDALRAEYDYVIVDMPRALVDWVGSILKRANQILIVSDTSVPSVRQARRLIDFYREDHVGLPVDIVVNREDRPLLKSGHLKEAEKVLDAKLLHWLPDNAKVARKAVDMGQPILTHASSSSLSKAIRKLAARSAVLHSAQNTRKA